MDGNITDRDEILKIILEDSSKDLKDKDILDALKSNQIAENINSTHRDRLTRGEIMSDRLATYLGSWKFIVLFVSILMLWIIINVAMVEKSFDPFPFIFLNLVLSLTAAIQAPILMMSQNRQSSKDRIRSENDYIVNLKAEVLTEDLHNQISTLIANQKIILKDLELLSNK